MPWGDPNDNSAAESFAYQVRWMSMTRKQKAVEIVKGVLAFAGGIAAGLVIIWIVILLFQS